MRPWYMDPQSKDTHLEAYLQPCHGCRCYPIRGLMVLGNVLVLLRKILGQHLHMSSSGLVSRLSPTTRSQFVL
jgi:hypothetical protein